MTQPVLHASQTKRYRQSCRRSSPGYGGSDAAWPLAPGRITVVNIISTIAIMVALHAGRECGHPEPPATSGPSAVAGGGRIDKASDGRTKGAGQIWDHGGRRPSVRRRSDARSLVLGRAAAGATACAQGPRRGVPESEELAAAETGRVGGVQGFDLAISQWGGRGRRPRPSYAPRCRTA